VSRFRKIRDQDARLEPAGQHQGLSEATQHHPPAEPGATADQRLALPASRQRQRHRLPQGVHRARQCRGRSDLVRRRSAGVLAAFRRRRDRPVGQPKGRARDREPRHRRTAHARMGRHPPAHRSERRPGPVLSLYRVSATMNVRPDITVAPEAADDGLWFKDAIVYQLHVKAFADNNNDGVGDFAGLTGKLDYLRDLGVDTLWLLPFYPSPGRDDGYDISDYGDINPAFGTMKDFRRFMHEAKRLGLRVITELVINHTSDQHDWFKRAKRSPKGTSARDWYVWSDTDQKYQCFCIVSAATEKSNWTWDPE